MPLEYAKTHQCVKCGLTSSEKYLKVARRIDDVIGIDETVFVCVDERGCARMKLEREALFQRQGLKPFVAAGAPDPLKPPKPVRKTKATLQFFPPLKTALSHLARKRWRKARKKQLARLAAQVKP